jgi:hypothetical protein
MNAHSFILACFPYRAGFNSEQQYGAEGLS